MLLTMKSLDVAEDSPHAEKRVILGTIGFAYVFGIVICSEEDINEQYSLTRRR